MDLVNRSIAIIRPKQPYLDWIRTLPGPYFETLDDLRSQGRAMLLPEASSSEAAVISLKDHAEKLFEMELEAWSPTRLNWPEYRGFETYVEWFEVEIELLVIDSVDGQIQKQPYE
jgi:hypothetical protein